MAAFLVTTVGLEFVVLGRPSPVVDRLVCANERKPDPLLIGMRTGLDKGLPKLAGSRNLLVLCRLYVVFLAPCRIRRLQG